MLLPILLALSAQTAPADGPEPEPAPTEEMVPVDEPGPMDDTARARAAYREGKTHYELGRFDKALAAFARAYEIKPATGLMFNLGQCHRHLRDWDKAEYFFERFIANAPASTNREVAVSLLDEVRGARAAEAAEKERIRREKNAALERKIEELSARITSGGGGSESELEELRAEVRRLSADDESAGEAEAARIERIAQLDEELRTQREESRRSQWLLWGGVGAGVLVATAAAAGIVALALPRPAVLPEGSLGAIDARPSR